MLSKIKQLFSAMDNSQSNISEHDLKTAVAALLIEVMRADNELQDDEQQVLNNTLKKYFSLSDEEVLELVEGASKNLDEAIDYFQFSKQINAQCSAEQRIDIIELLWRLAYADGELDKHEELVIRRVASLLYVTHEDFIAAKLAATKLS
ncbi:TerB family tellurite resistance protein [Pseudoalteromonas sp. MB41]|uniref:tellurite resistance TerB family protein n=1 Tax=unclassified Pseudoalteromonas TaxID=194690 RepID=UPI0015D561A3|nr:MULTISPECIES: TerB family tellurite resistance protein [unclassified Pseudoalteromonas]MCC9661688.1 TerB family tellurite resistance protein [Pseudoalteromonas sp. MB41]QLJ08151.1 TerB family tellurite resistance protein [Pseudoalteromonas sp. JSTW]